MTALSTGETYGYDANGNMLTRVEGGLTYTQTFDAENRLISVVVSGQTTSFIYDGDGNLVKKINPDGSKTLYVAGIYEVDKNSGGTVTGTKTYYPAAGAMRIGSTLYFVLKDHLGSSSVVTDASGNTVGEERYYPFGQTRLTTGTMLTDKLFTGQREITGLGIYYYGARFYSPYINRFLSADTMVSSLANPQSLNRYSYVLENPLKYTDPTGHKECAEMDSHGSCMTGTQAMTHYIQSKYKKVKIKKGKWDDDDLLNIYTGLTNIKYKGFHGNTDAFDEAFGSVTFVSQRYAGKQAGGTTWQDGEIGLDPAKNDWTTVVHEMGHLFRVALTRKNERVPSYTEMHATVFDAGAGATKYARDDTHSPSEDFADSFLAVIEFGSAAIQHVSEPRIKTINALIQSYTNADHTFSPGR